MEREQTNGFEAAKDKALHILARRRHTKKELSEKLVRAGFLTDTADAVCAWAAGYGFLNDEEYARAFVSDSINYKSYGKKRIRQALLHKGVDACTADDVLAEFDFHEADKLAELLPKKLGGNFERKNIEKAIRHFAAKGYAYDEIKNAINTYKDNVTLGEDDEFEL